MKLLVQDPREEKSKAKEFIETIKIKDNSRTGQCNCIEPWVAWSKSRSLKYHELCQFLASWTVRRVGKALA